MNTQATGADWRFDRDAVGTFVFSRCSFDAQTGIAELGYRFDDSPEFVEVVTVPGAPFTLDAEREQAIAAALRLLHLIAGVSYYKAAVPKTIVIEGEAIDRRTADFLTMVYENGLGEFAYRNGLQLRGEIQFPVGDTSEVLAQSLGLRHHALVAIGGGKDSLVSIESLRNIGVDQTVTWIGGSQLIRACAERTGLPTLNLGRAISPLLFEINREGAWNGHIPVTAINSAIMTLAAIVLGYDQVVFSNEKSSSYGSLIEGTGEVNHQWSKGWAFEDAFAAYVQDRIAADLSYYSLLRPLSELAVARQFTRTDHYDAHFSSCNRNFHILGERPVNRWCGACPKCHFVFLALAPFMSKPRLVSIFGRNLLDDESQTAGFDALLEYRDHKPFECVGEGKESRAAMTALTERPEWQHDAIVQRFAREIRPQLSGEDLRVSSLLHRSDDAHRIPPAVADALFAYWDQA